jgi:hypothetical protein
MQKTRTNRKTKTPNYHRRLLVSLGGIVIVGIIGILSITAFGPKLGYLLGFLSRHKNDPGKIPFLKPNTPFFSNMPEATNKDKITLEGFSQPGFTVKLYVNGPEKEKAVVDNEGVFTFTDIGLIQGRNTIYAKALDAYNNESDQSKTYMIVLDKEKPEIEIEKPKNGTTVKNLDGRVTISGKINERAKISINERNVVQKPDYSFEYLLGVSEGWKEIEVKAIDPAGNEAIEKIKVNYQRTSD